MTKKKTSGRRWELLSDRPAPPPEPERSLPPAEQRVRISLEKRASGRMATIVTGLVLTADERKGLAGDLRKSFGCGGTVTPDGFELQGDFREAVRSELLGRGFRPR